jgi:threonine/homoserine/homoserine lactone efflux protein
VTSFWHGVLAGYGIAIPVGAIAVLIVDVGLRRGFGTGFAAGAGAVAADLLYASLAALAGEGVALVLAPHALGLRVASGVGLLALGGYGLWKARHIGQGQPLKATDHHHRSRLRTFTQFLGLTLLNPLTITYFGALILGDNPGATGAAVDRALHVLGAALASLSWQTLLAAIGALGKRHLAPRFQRATSVAGNLVVVGLGLRVVVRVLKQLG